MTTELLKESYSNSYTPIQQMSRSAKACIASGQVYTNVLKMVFPGIPVIAERVGGVLAHCPSIVHHPYQICYFSCKQVLCGFSMRQSLPHMHSNKVRLGSYHFWYQPGPVHTGRLDVLEEVDHTLSLQTLQLGVDGDEGSRATHTITEWCVCVLCVALYVLVFAQSCMLKIKW